MPHDIQFRVALVALSILLPANHFVFHRRAPPQRLAFKEPAGTIEILLALAASSWTVALACYVAGFAWFSHYAVPLPLWTRWAGVAAMLICVPLSQWVYSELGVHFSKRLEIMTGHQLIRTGPYRFVRHPMYATLFLCAVATCLITANCVVIVSALVLVLVFSMRMRKEEAMLIARFGDEYREYKRQTWALVPKLVTLS